MKKMRLNDTLNNNMLHTLILQNIFTFNLLFMLQHHLNLSGIRELTFPYEQNHFYQYHVKQFKK